MTIYTKEQIRIQRERAQKSANHVPAQVVHQRKIALEEANRIRILRAKLKRDLKAGRKSIYDTLVEPPEWISTMQVFDLMLACPSYGKGKVTKILRLTRISSSRLIGDLSIRETTEIVSLLRR
jgi:hypothetical protein